MNAFTYRLVGEPDVEKFDDEEIFYEPLPDPVAVEERLRQRANEEFAVPATAEIFGEFMQEREPELLAELACAIAIVLHSFDRSAARDVMARLRREWIEWRMETFSKEDRKAAEEE